MSLSALTLNKSLFPNNTININKNRWNTFELRFAIYHTNDTKAARSKLCVKSESNV